MIQADSLTRVYGKDEQAICAVNNVSLSVEPATRAAIIGKSGSGKSTLLNLLAGLDHPSGGTLVIDEQRLDQLGRAAMAAYRRDVVGMVFQAFQLIPQRTALQNVELPLMLQGVPRRSRQAKAREWLEQVGLGHRVDHFPFELSGGEQQRVAIARALVHQPKLLLADEPTGNLDSTTSQQIEQLLVELCCRSQVTFLLVTHDLDLAGRMSERLFSMADGSLTEQSV